MNGQRKITYKSARNKGKQLERDVAKALCDIGINAKRVPMSGALAWLKGDVAELNPGGEQDQHIHECKNHETLDLNSWWRQAAAESTKGEIPALHFRSNRRATCTVLRSTDFDELVYQYELIRPEITLNLVDVPKRTNFWKFYDQDVRSMIDIFLWEITDKETGEIEELVTMSFDLYLKLRKAVNSSLSNQVEQPTKPLVQPLPGSIADTESAPSLHLRHTTAG